MPGFDGTGPRGEGSMTGGGRGYCTTSYAGNRSFGRGRGGMPWGGGRGWGGGSRGRGFGRRWLSGQGAGNGLDFAPQQISTEDEHIYLTNQLSALESEMQEIKKRLEELNETTKKEKK